METTLEKIVTKHNLSGGVTANPKTHEILKNVPFYAVPILPKRGVQIQGQILCMSDLKDFLRANLGVLVSNNNIVISTWYDETSVNGATYIHI